MVLNVDTLLFRFRSLSLVGVLAACERSQAQDMGSGQRISFGLKEIADVLVVAQCPHHVSYQEPVAAGM